MKRITLLNNHLLIVVISIIILFVSFQSAYAISYWYTFVYEYSQNIDGDWDYTGTSWRGGFSNPSLTIPVDYDSDSGYAFLMLVGTTKESGINHIKYSFNDNSDIYPSDIPSYLTVTGYSGPNDVYSPPLTTWDEELHGHGGTQSLYPGEVHEFIVSSNQSDLVYNLYYGNGFFIRPENGYNYTEDFNVVWEQHESDPLGGGIGTATGFRLGVDFDVSPNPVPVPSTILLLGPSLIGVFGIRKKFKK